VLTTAAKSIAEIITVTSHVNVDFEDVKTVMKDSGAAVMGSAVTFGENRARKAAEGAMLSPLLDNTDILGAKKVLLSITFGENGELTMDELKEITDFIQEQAGDDAEVIWGYGVDPTLGEKLRVTFIATGFRQSQKQSEVRKVYDLESDRQIKVVTPIQTPEVSRKQISLFEESAPEVKKEEKKIIYELDKPIEELKEEAADIATNDIIVEESPKIEVKWKLDTEKAMDEDKKRILSEQSKERIKRLKGLNSSLMQPEEFKEKLEVPAYMRKNVNLQDVPHSSERKISRFNLNDENEIMGNNKFLHDNVD